MNLDSFEALESCVLRGVYSTYMSAPNGHWLGHHEATFSDYIAMRPGDNIYFFIKRKIYGIGELVSIGRTGSCCFLNYPEASNPEQLGYEEIKREALVYEGVETPHFRWICLFKPTPHFFLKGLDMDDMLSSNPSAFRMLRAFWKLSFLKFDDTENQAFKDALLKANQDALADHSGRKYISKWEEFHKQIEPRIKEQHRLNARPFLESCATGPILNHEMALELALLNQICIKHEATVEIFGTWDYLHHQVIASPPKPIDYMDKMDVFGYSFIRGYEPTRAKYLVCELKKGEATRDDAEQLMKYVDWVKDEYAFGDYSMIEAYLVASGFDETLKRKFSEISSRRYIVGRRPAISSEWKNLSLVDYSYNDQTGYVDFHKLNSPPLPAL